MLFIYLFILHIVYIQYVFIIKYIVIIKYIIIYNYCTYCKHSCQYYLVCLPVKGNTKIMALLAELGSDKTMFWNGLKLFLGLSVMSNTYLHIFRNLRHFLLKLF